MYSTVEMSVKFDVGLRVCSLVVHSQNDACLSWRKVQLLVLLTLCGRYTVGLGADDVPIHYIHGCILNDVYSAVAASPAHIPERCSRLNFFLYYLHSARGYLQDVAQSFLADRTVFVFHGKCVCKSAGPAGRFGWSVFRVVFCDAAEKE